MMGILQKIFGGGPAHQVTPAAPPGKPLEPGARIADKYVVRSLLGRGGMGEVYLVEDASGELRAAKVMRTRDDAKAGDLKAFRAETLSLLNIGNHPFVVRLFEVHDHGRDTVLIMQYVAPEDGCTSLQEYITRTSDYTDTVLGTWAVEFCVGMEHAIANGMTAHRDIKPGNLLVGASPFLKIADFGLALAATQHPAVGVRSSALTALQRLHAAEGRAISGTPGYIAPELLTGEGKAGVHSDMFSFGVTLWQLAARSPVMPFEATFSGDLDAYQQQLNRQTLARRVRTIDSPFFNVIRRCLDPEPTRRYSDFPALREAIKAAAKSGGLQAIDFLVNPENRGTVDEHVSRARGYLVLGRRARALKILDKAVEFDSSSVSARMARGDALLQADSVKALGDFKAAHERAPDSDAPAVGMAKALIGIGDLAAADRILGLVLARHPRNTEARLQQAALLSRQGRHEASIALIDNVIAEVPSHPTAHEFRGRAVWTHGNKAEAKASFLRALDVNPLSISASLALAALFHDLGDLKAQQMAYERLVTLYCMEAEVLNAVAVHMSENGCSRDAGPLFGIAAELDGSTEAKAVGFVNQGNALMNAKDIAGARLKFVDAIKLQPLGALAHSRLGDWETEHGDAQRGANLLATAADLDIENAMRQADAGTAFLRLDDLGRSRSYLERSLKLFPEQPLVRYNLAVVHLQQGHFDIAIQQLALAVKHDAGYGRGWFLKAQLEAHVQRAAAAAESAYHGLRAASSLSTSEVEGLRGLQGDLKRRGYSFGG